MKTYHALILTLSVLISHKESSAFVSRHHVQQTTRRTNINNGGELRIQRTTTTLRLPHQEQKFMATTSDDNDKNNNVVELSSSGLASMLVTPIEKAIDSTGVIDGAWVFTYSDLSPENESTLQGKAFLATNLAYALCGVALLLNGDTTLGTITEIASVASYSYHYNQLVNKDESAVRLALLVDYIVALPACFVTFIYCLTCIPSGDFPLAGLIICLLGLGCFQLGCNYEKQVQPYLFFHGMWHIFGGLGGYMVGQAHLVAAASSTAIQ